MKKKLTFLFLILLFGLFLADLSLGSVAIPLKETLRILLGFESKSSWEVIILKMRLPRALTAMVVGVGLSLSGLQMQTFFQNPLAGPFVLGISSGASLGVAIWVFIGVGAITLVGNWGLVLAATIGAAFVMALVMLVSWRIRNNMALLIIGLMFGSATGAIVAILQFFSQAEELQLYVIWTFGSLGAVSWKELFVFVPLVCIGVMLVFLIQKPLNALLMGQNYAISMGVDMKKVRYIVIVSTSLLAGSITAFCGPIGFIGIAIPHLTKYAFKTSNHHILIPTVCLVGANLMLVCDLVSQLPLSDKILPINAVTALLGAPVVIWVILRALGIKKSS